MENEQYRIETVEDIKKYIANIEYALNHGARITFQEERAVDKRRPPKYTNKDTIANLFPRENPMTVLKRELRKISVKEYIKTVKDKKYPDRSEMREFGKIYYGKEVYIKIRTELLNADGNHTIFVMSFHLAEFPFTAKSFPYKDLSD